MFITPGTWNVIPQDTKIRAKLKGTLLEGRLSSVQGEHREKYLVMRRSWDDAVETLYARDGWEVTYQVNTLAEMIDENPVGSRFECAQLYFVKLTSSHAAQIILEDYSNMPNYTPAIFKISQLHHIPSSNYRVS